MDAQTSGYGPYFQLVYGRILAVTCHSCGSENLHEAPAGPLPTSRRLHWDALLLECHACGEVNRLYRHDGQALPI